jgi:hypothetical protein
MDPLWVDAKNYLISQGQQLSTHGLNAAMNLLASNPQLRPSAVKSGGGTNAIAAGLGAPTDQIVQTSLAPPAPPTRNSPKAGGGSSSKGASSGNRTAGGTSASSKAAHAIPAPVEKPRTVDAQSPVAADGSSLTQTPAPQPSSPIAPAQAASGDNSDQGLPWGRIAAGGAGLAGVLMALLGARRGEGPGMRPRNSLEGEVIPPSGRPVPTGGGRGGPIIDGQVDPIQQLLGGQSNIGASAPTDRGYSPTDPLSGSPLSTADELWGQAYQQSQNQLPPPPPIQMPNETSGPVITPPTLDDIIMQLTNQTPTGQSPAGPVLPPSLPPGGPRNNSPIGTLKGTRPPTNHPSRGSNNGQTKNFR